MTKSCPLTGGLLTVLLLLAVPDYAPGQGLDEARTRLPTFTSNAEGQRADIYIYYPSVDLMMRLEASAGAGLFTESEFGYLAGSLEFIASQLLANAYYGSYDQATIAQMAQRLYIEASTMKAPFRRSRATLGVQMDESGLAVEFSGATEDGIEFSNSVKLTWDDILAAQ